jgi:hypothetical protein
VSLTSRSCKSGNCFAADSFAFTKSSLDFQFSIYQANSSCRSKAVGKMSESVMGEWKVVRESRGESLEEQLSAIDGEYDLCKPSLVSFMSFA